MTFVGERTEFRLSTKELNRLREFCRSAAVKAGVFCVRAGLIARVLGLVSTFAAHLFVLASEQRVFASE